MEFAASKILQQVQVHAPLFASMQLPGPVEIQGHAQLDYDTRCHDLQSLPPPPKHVAEIYLKVLRLLQEAERSGLWPKVSAGRSRVLELNGHNGLPRGSVGGKSKGKRRKTKNNKPSRPKGENLRDTVAKKSKQDAGLKTAQAADGQPQGEPNESQERAGTFSIGAMPPPHKQPANRFPELLDAAFELERAIAPPGRKLPSTTIAVNKHAQFLPHTDSGAGSGTQCMLCRSMIGLEMCKQQRACPVSTRPTQFFCSTV